ncbi:26S proteasome non-ATPase regulatory subunit 7 [Oopsacas minuta]|uniref:26S proteasome non-ATPase regulatory subunit 7 n=1 Tax=Oopsacas minuta TaxID=111878 RepID=A0AAV7JMD0_9METZ|nr:26S proteasome non-ATPase regulatory subunit 7 [Oopsacas minuta]
MPKRTPKRVIVHPLVLLSVVDHFNRMSKEGKRVVGCLLGSWRSNGVVDVSNSFAVPFDEDDNDPTIWYLDHNYMEQMAAMFRKVNSKERVIGWYHSGPKLRINDVAVNDIVSLYCNDPILVMILAQPKELGIPTDAYYAVEEIHDDGTPTSKTFNHVASEIGAEEAEEVGVEHLLRDIRDTTIGSLSQSVSSQLQSVKGLMGHTQHIELYLSKVLDGTYPVNHTIIYLLQDILSLLPDLTLPQLISSFYSNANDRMLVIYIVSLVRAIIALHDLIDNKLSNQAIEKEVKEEKRKDKTVVSKETEKEKV